MLIRMLAQQCGYQPGELIWQGGDVHLYLNHEALVTEQLARTPAGAPKMRLVRKPESIFDYRIEDFEVIDYQPQAHIAAPVAVLSIFIKRQGVRFWYSLFPIILLFQILE